MTTISSYSASYSEAFIPAQYKEDVITGLFTGLYLTAYSNGNLQ
jgi:hypothetical protein